MPGDLSDKDAIVEFLTSPEALNLPDKIEAVSNQRLKKMIEERPFLAVLFCILLNIYFL